MGTGSVTATGTPASSTSTASWRLKPEYAQQTQGLIVSPFAHLPLAQALFLTLPDNCGGSWLRALREKVTITDATGPTPCAAVIAFTWMGLKTMRLDDDALGTFSVPFQEGMHQRDRRRRLSDEPETGLVVKGGPVWGANTPDLHADIHDKPEPPTPITVHAALLLYAADDAALSAQTALAEAALLSSRVGIARRLALPLGTREHFGYADGMSQPVPFGDAIVPSSSPRADEERKWHGVAAGDILIGHLNAHHELAPGPLVAASPNTPNPLPPTGAPEGFRNLGLNGSYLVIRELRQDVAAFWNAMDKAAQSIGDPNIDANWLAERVVGRTRSGDPLAPGGTLPPEDGKPANNFGFAQSDVHGFGCPLGAHVRRANPRDSLPSRDGPDPSLAATTDLRNAANSHRILRRGRKYGPDIADLRTDDGQERGLLFMCLNSDIERQFEFIQQTWLLNQSFATLFDETDPLLGPRGRFTIPAAPLRLRPQVETFVQFVGGEYFFLPSLAALDYLASLPMAPQP